MAKQASSGTKQQKQPLTQKLQSLLNGLRLKNAPKTQAKNLIAGGIVFWYMDNGVRNFVMVKPIQKDESIRFVSCLGTGEHADITSAVHGTIKRLLGHVFYRSLDKSLIAYDRVASVTCFKHNDNGEESSVHGVFWCMQITPEQAQLCQPTDETADIIAVPESAMLGGDISQSHQAIYQSVARHLNMHLFVEDFGLEQVEDIVGSRQMLNRTIH